MNPDEFYEPIHGDTYDRLMKKARRTNQERDWSERKSGWTAPGDGDLAEHLRDAICAIAAGLNSGDWPAVAEGLDMLQQAEVRARSLRR
jgi:hypothetical protein